MRVLERVERTRGAGAHCRSSASLLRWRIRHEKLPLKQFRAVMGSFRHHDHQHGTTLIAIRCDLTRRPVDSSCVNPYARRPERNHTWRCALNTARCRDLTVSVMLRTSPVILSTVQSFLVQVKSCLVDFSTYLSVLDLSNTLPLSSARDDRSADHALNIRATSDHRE